MFSPEPEVDVDRQGAVRGDEVSSRQEVVRSPVGRRWTPSSKVFILRQMLVAVGGGSGGVEVTHNSASLWYRLVSTKKQ